jgi:hypothetical protein
MASGQRSTDSSGAGDQTAPGLQTPRSWGLRVPRRHNAADRDGAGDRPRTDDGAQEEPPRPWAQRGDLPSREDGRRRKGRLRERSQPTLAFTYTLRPRLAPHRAKMSTSVRKLLGGSDFCMGVVRARPKSHTKWASFFRPLNPQKSYLVIFDVRSTGEHPKATGQRPPTGAPAWAVPFPPPPPPPPPPQPRAGARGGASRGPDARNLGTAPG